MEECVICGKSLATGGDIVTLRQKGSDCINGASEMRGRDIRTVPGQRVHTACRLDFTNKNAIARDLRKSGAPAERTESPVLRSSTPVFNFEEHCLFCGKPAKYGGRKRGFDVIPVQTTVLQKTITEICRKRGDDWAQTVMGRLEYARDIRAKDAVYHRQCNVNFRTENVKIPKRFSDTEKSGKRGRQANAETQEAFLRVCNFIEENDDEQITIGDLIEKMDEFLEGTGCSSYGFTHMKTKLNEHFGQEIVIAELDGKPNIVTLRKNAAAILHSFYEQNKKSDSEAEAVRLVETAAKLIRNDIKCIEVSNEYFPSIDNMMHAEKALQYLPSMLNTFLRIVFTGKDIDVKIASVEQAIMAATRPRVLLAPLQLGLSVEMHHQFGSRFLVDTLHSHGFGCSYAVVQEYEKCSAVFKGSKTENLNSNQVVQFMADNVDHDLCTIDGHGTFHGIGIIAAFTPGMVSASKPIPRVSVTAEDIRQVGKINIKYYVSQLTGTSSLKYKALLALEVTDPTRDIDILWEMSFFLRPNRPSWSGMMQTVHNGSHPGKSSVLFLPMIDLNPSDQSCIYSMLYYVCKLAEGYNVTPVITFDQPLWLKATMMKHSETVDSLIRSVVIRLGGFHTQMSFLGSIGHLMAGSGLSELLETIYATNILSGKAVSRAVRGHLLVYASLHTMLFANAYNYTLPTADEGHEDKSGEDSHESQSNSDLDTARDFLNGLLDCDDCGDKVPKAVSRIQSKIAEEKTLLCDHRTAQLWLQYLDMVQILCQFIKAERTGDWFLHLKSVWEMLPYFAASGHNCYTKCAYLYLQELLCLEADHPDVYRSFCEGHHVIRRSERYWAGLSTDLIIEQVLMRSVKSRGGLTHGRGFSESQRTQWLLSMPACSEVNFAMQTLSGVTYVTSEQHKDVTKARQKKDVDDTFDLLKTLKQLDPFGSDKSLRSLVSGVTANKYVNVDSAKKVGQAILDSMVGMTINEFSFKRKNQVVTLAAKTLVTTKDDVIQIEPQLLFQRLSVIASKEEDPSTDLKYELCSYPAALFDSTILLREANKPALADAMWEYVKDSQPDSLPSTDLHYVLDGGSLIQRIPWPRKESVDHICQLYVDYVTRRYSKATIVFDGYPAGPSTKDVTHLRRTKGCCGPEVHFSDQTVISLKKTEFLSNPVNKQRFINILSDKLERVGCVVQHAKEDADTLIVMTSVQSAEFVDTVLVGEDTDLLVLLCYHAKNLPKAIYFRPEPKLHSKSCRVWDIQKTRDILKETTCEYILFAHAISGCDTTSRLYGVGKHLVFKKLLGDSEFRKHAEIFMSSPYTQHDQITEAGEKAIVSIYNGGKNDSLDKLRCQRFKEKVVRCSKEIQAQVLPPTSGAAKYHSLRVFHQISEWKGESLNATEYGWKEKDGKFIPLRTDLPPAPDHLLEVIHCNCKTGCSTIKCTCRRNGLECTFACGDCKGTSCSNTKAIETDVDE